MKKSNILYIFVICLLSSMLFGCSRITTIEPNDESITTNEQKSSEPEANLVIESEPDDVYVAEENNTRFFNSSADRIGNLTTYDDLNKNSEFIVTGKVISSKPVFQNDTLYTLSEIQVTKSFKGNIDDTSIISVVEMGGRTTFGEYEKNCDITQKSFETNGERLDADKKIAISINGFFPMEASEEVLLFLVDSTGFLEQFDTTVYAIIADYDGKLFLQADGSYKRTLPSANDTLSFDEKGYSITTDIIGK